MEPGRRLWGRIAGAAAEICVNFVLPYVIYVGFQRRSGQMHALLAASLPPILWSIAEFLRKRRVDALSLFVVAGIALSLLAFLGGGSAKFLQLRENLVTGVIGLAFLGSAAIGRPLIYDLARAMMARKSAAQAAEFAALRAHGHFRATMTIMTIMWGAGLLAQTGIACVLVFALPVATYLLVSPFLGYGMMGGLGIWTLLYGNHRRRVGMAMRAAAEKAPPA